MIEQDVAEDDRGSDGTPRIQEWMGVSGLYEVVVEVVVVEHDLSWRSQSGG